MKIDVSDQFLKSHLPTEGEEQIVLYQVATRGYSKVLTSRLLCPSVIKRLAPSIVHQIFQLLFFLKQLIGKNIHSTLMESE